MVVQRLWAKVKQKDKRWTRNKDAWYTYIHAQNDHPMQILQENIPNPSKSSQTPLLATPGACCPPKESPAVSATRQLKMGRMKHCWASLQPKHPLMTLTGPMCLWQFWHPPLKCSSLRWMMASSTQNSQQGEKSCPNSSVCLSSHSLKLPNTSRFAMITSTLTQTTVIQLHILIIIKEEEDPLIAPDD